MIEILQPRRILLGLSLVGLPFSEGHSQVADSALQTEFAGIETSREQAVMKCDTVALNQVFADSLEALSPKNGRMDRRQLLTTLCPNGPLYSLYVVDNMIATRYGSLVIVSARDEAWAIGSTSAHPRWVVRVYAQAGGQWRIIRSTDAP